MGEKLNLVPYGNHARGAKFIDGSHWTTDAGSHYQRMCLQIPGFFENGCDEKEKGKKP
jgi:hypothetical protein